MALFKSEEEKAAARAQRAREGETRQERKARERWAASPIGQATAAHGRGDALFQIALSVGGDAASTLGEIEEIGWHLEHAGYASEISGTSTTNGDGVMNGLYLSGDLTGIYLFRRTLDSHGDTGDPPEGADGTAATPG